MRAITFAKGNEQHLKDCKDALCQSTLGEKYFSSPGSAENAILEGIRQRNLYVALIGEAWVFSSSLWIFALGIAVLILTEHYIRIPAKIRNMS